MLTLLSGRNALGGLILLTVFLSAFVYAMFVHPFRAGVGFVFFCLVFAVITFFIRKHANERRTGILIVTSLLLIGLALIVIGTLV